MAFRDRSDAGKQLSEKLGDHADEDVVVLGLEGSRNCLTQLDHP